MAHLKTYTADSLLINYYKEVETDFVKHFQETVKKYFPFDDLKRKVLKKEISITNNILKKLDSEFSETLHQSLSKYAELVKKSEWNILDDFIFPIPIKGLSPS
jgi:spore coat polysaccharide biosynthesis predicted glycosyltransferase SpsG